MPASGNNDSINFFHSMSQTMSTQYKTLTIWHVKGRTFEKHLNYILETDLLHTTQQKMSQNEQLVPS